MSISGFFGQPQTAPDERGQTETYSLIPLQCTIQRVQTCPIFPRIPEIPLHYRWSSPIDPDLKFEHSLVKLATPVPNIPFQPYEH